MSLWILLGLVGCGPRNDGRQFVVYSAEHRKILGVWAGSALAYILRTEDRLALIDTGSDPNAKSLTRAIHAMGLAPDNVEAILLTHGHREQTAATAQFGKATLYIGRDDRRLLWREKLPRGPRERLLTRLLPAPQRASQPLHLVLPGDRLEVAGWTLDAIAVPGHTRGSTIYRADSLLFTGDSVIVHKDGTVEIPSWLDSRSPSMNVRALGRLRHWDYEAVADSRTGHTTNARIHIDAFLDSHAL